VLDSSFFATQRKEFWGHRNERKIGGKRCRRGWREERNDVTRKKSVMRKKAYAETNTSRWRRQPRAAQPGIGKAFARTARGKSGAGGVDLRNRPQVRSKLRTQDKVEGREDSTGSYYE